MQQDELSLHGPFASNILHGYDQHGAIDIHEHSISFCRHEPHQVAALWSKVANKYPDWQFIVKMRMSGDLTAGGNGMALWYTKEGHGNGAAMGAPDKWHGLGLFLDTFKSDGHGHNPTIYGIMNDGHQEYHGHQTGAGHFFASCLKSLRNTAHPIGIRVTHSKGKVTVETDDRGDGHHWSVCFEQDGLHLPVGYYFGISASTNERPSVMEITSMTVYGMEVATTQKVEQEIRHAMHPDLHIESHDPVGHHHEEDAVRHGSTGYGENHYHDMHRGGNNKHHGYHDRQESDGHHEHLHSSYEHNHEIREGQRHLEITVEKLTETVSHLSHMVESIKAHLDRHHHLKDGGNEHSESFAMHEEFVEIRHRLEVMQGLMTGNGNNRGNIGSMSYGARRGRWTMWLMFAALQVGLIMGAIALKKHVDNRKKLL